MGAWKHGRVAMVGAAFALLAPLSAAAAHAPRHGGHVRSPVAGRDAARAIYAGISRYSRHHVPSNGYAGGGLQCVPFARENTGIELTGNAVNWWNNAEGLYERGARPEVGSILNFRGTHRMRLGHVAVVSNVVGERTLQIDHANWSGRGVVTRNVTVVDVSPANDWSAVRVALGNGDFGSVYPTYGFIYDRPDKGTMLANAEAGSTRVAAAQPVPIVLNPPKAGAAPLDLSFQGSPVALLASDASDEVAEDAGAYRGRRGGWRAPAVRYGRAAMQASRYGLADTRWHRRGELMLAQLTRGADRFTTGRMMGGQVLFMGHLAGRPYLRPARSAMAKVRHAGLVLGQHGQAYAGSRRRGHRA